MDNDMNLRHIRMTDDHQEQKGLPPCPLCASTGAVTNAGATGVFGKPLALALCEDCGLYYAADMPSRQFLDDYYARDYFSELSGSRLLYRLKSWFARLRAASQFSYITRHVTRSGEKRILELGSADGTFLSLFQSAGWSVRGLEFNEYMAQKAREKYGIALERKHLLDLDPKRERYNVIALPHVLEHLPNPAEILAHCKKLLGERGIIFIELPNSPLPAETTGEELAFYLETTHLYNFRPGSLAKLVKQAGLAPLTVDRFFYAVPRVLKSRSAQVGGMFMTGQVPWSSPSAILSAIASAIVMGGRFLAGFDPMRPIPPEAPWQGLGDNIRLIADLRSGHTHTP